ncbi:MAG: 50S ribosomal protein L23 [Candidatus Geothermarchaeales archaeon]
MSEVAFFRIVKYPLITEKAVTQVESLNKVTFMVDEKSTKRKVKAAVETYFDVSVDKVNVLTTPKGEKKAIVTFPSRDAATEVAIALGII